jgi:hypothetical protein
LDGPRRLAAFHALPEVTQGEASQALRDAIEEHEAADRFEVAG